uniref:Uncharacterized protein n=1 Tax=viral metagenome TaxID=1070528 RepID=A0A6C0C182_9ZZZZ
MYDDAFSSRSYPPMQIADDYIIDPSNEKHIHPHSRFTGSCPEPREPRELCDLESSCRGPLPDPWRRPREHVPEIGGLAQSRKTFFYPLNSCTLSWAPIGTQGSVVGCRSEAGVISTECKWNRGVTDFAAYQCQQTVTSPESVTSVEKHDACILSLDPAVGMARFSCDIARP